MDNTRTTCSRMLRVKLSKLVRRLLTILAEFELWVMLYTI
jgi:hypothetical protein